MKTAPPRHGRLLTMQEVAETLGASGKTVGRWIKSGDLHAHYLGRQVRVSEEDLATYLAKNRR